MLSPAPDVVLTPPKQRAGSTDCDALDRLPDSAQPERGTAFAANWNTEHKEHPGTLVKASKPIIGRWCRWITNKPDMLLDLCD